MILLFCASQHVYESTNELVLAAHNQPANEQILNDAGSCWEALTLIAAQLRATSRREQLIHVVKG